MNRRTAAVVATAALASTWVLPFTQSQAAAEDPPEPDPGAASPDDGVVPPEVQAELAADTTAMQSDALIAVPPSEREMLQVDEPLLPLPASDGPMVLHGAVTGHGTGGGELLVFLADEVDDWGATIRPMSPIARVSLASSGSFVVSPQIDARVAKRLLPSGDLNLLLAGTFQGQSFERNVVRTYHADTNAWTDSSSAANPAVSIDASSPLALLSTSDRVARQYLGCSNTVVRSYTVEAIVGEVHTSSLFNGTFSYGSSADSTLGVASKGASGGWKVDGEKSITRSSTAGNSVPLSSNESRHMYGSFEYRDIRTQCSDGYSVQSWTTATPYRWAGGLRRGASMATKYCGGDDWAYRQRVEPGATFSRTSGKAQTWSGGASVYGLGLSARSGFSSSVHQTWKAGKSASWVCGNGQYPSGSKRVFTSNTKA